MSHKFYYTSTLRSESQCRVVQKCDGTVVSQPNALVALGMTHFGRPGQRDGVTRGITRTQLGKPRTTPGWIVLARVDDHA